MRCHIRVPRGRPGRQAVQPLVVNLDDKLFTYQLYHNAYRDNMLIEDSATTSRLLDHTITNDNPPPTPCNQRTLYCLLSFVNIDINQEPPWHLRSHQRLHNAQHKVQSSIE
jgi:hypothetical protein